jgi:hypothetical protein
VGLGARGVLDRAHRGPGANPPEQDDTIPLAAEEGQGQGQRRTRQCVDKKVAVTRVHRDHAEYSPVIGWYNPITWRFGLGPHKSAILPANHRAVFCVDHHTTEFRQTTV